jgi:hypothetical protein
MRERRQLGSLAGATPAAFEPGDWCYGASVNAGVHCQGNSNVWLPTDILGTEFRYFPGGTTVIITFNSARAPRHWHFWARAPGRGNKIHEPDAGRGGGVARENRSDHRMDAVICIATNRVTIAPMVIASPVNPLKKKAEEKSTR